MSEYIISRRLSSNSLYAYYKGRFWFWDEERCIWKESHLLSQRFEREHNARHSLTPERFMADLTKFQPMDDYELDSTMLDALKNAKPCKTAPVEPVKEEPECATVPNADAAATTAESAVPNATEETLTTSASVADASESYREKSPSCSSSAPSVPAESSFAGVVAGGTSSPNLTAPASTKMPTAFDFSALGDLSGQAEEADQQFDLHYGTAQDEYLISCIYLARVHALTAKAGRYGGGTWTKWYESKGLSHGSSIKMVQNGEAFKSSTVDDLKSLPAMTRKDLNLIARSGCAEQLTAAAGDSQRVQGLLAQIKAKEHELEETRARLKNSCLQEEQAHDALQAANAQLEATQADVTNLQQQYAQMSQKANDAEEARIAAEAREEEAWQMQSKAEARARNAEEALKKQPITAVVDKDEVQRQADALAAKAKAQASKQIEDAQRRAREAEEKFEKLQQTADGFLAPEQACAQQAKIIADSMRSMYLGWFGLANGTGTPLARMAAPIYQVCDEIRESLEEDTTINPTAAGSEEDAEREALFE